MDSFTLNYYISSNKTRFKIMNLKDCERYILWQNTLIFDPELSYKICFYS